MGRHDSCAMMMRIDQAGKDEMPLGADFVGIGVTRVHRGVIAGGLDLAVFHDDGPVCDHAVFRQRRGIGHDVAAAQQNDRHPCLSS